jgi:2-keto-4-pentenoate hydratase
MFKNGQFIEEGVGRNSLRSPALCLAELGVAVQKRTPGECLRAGEIVSSGTLTAGHLTEKGDQWRVEIEGLPLPTLTLQLA